MPAYPRARVTGDTREAQWRLSHVQAVRQSTEAGTTERANAITELAAKPVIDWRGKHRTIAERTLRDWIARYEAAGLAGLMRKAPRNAGERRVHLSRPWDQAIRSKGLTEDAVAELAAIVRKRVRGEWACGTPSWPTVQLNTLPVVVELTRKAGIDLPDLAMRRLCQVPRRFVEHERRFALVALSRKDAARFAAEAIPRVQRDRSHLRPGDWLAADVHHLDILFRCADGREVTPKAVAWMDLATNRARLDFFIMPKGEMIRREHVIQSFVSLCEDPDWGVPSRLYTDNGGEYNWAELADDLSKLKKSLELRVDEAPDAGAVGVQRARPYNPQGKVIEGLFSDLEGVAFAQLPGWIGGDRMRKKTANQGRAPVPFPGDEARLREALATALNYYHVKPKAGHLANKSPNESFAAFVEAGWTATTLDPWEMAVAFSNQVVKPVRSGGTIRLGGKDFRADDLQSFVGHKVLVRQPLYGDRETLFVFTEYGQPIAVARPEAVYVFGDPRGAGEQSRRAKALTRTVRALEAESDPATAGGERAMAAVVTLFGTAPHAPPSDAVIRLNPEFSEAALMGKAAPARAEEETDRKRTKFARKHAILTRMVANG